MAKSRAKQASPSRPYEVLFQMVIGKWISQALGTVVEIGVPEQLAKGARRSSDIAREAGVSEDGIYRLLRALASVGLFVESADRRFKLTGMGKLLLSNHPESLAGYARFVAHDSAWRPWGQLGYSVKTGMPAFDHVFNVPIFEHLSRNPEVAGGVGGGTALLLAPVLRRHKTMRAVLFDLPHVAAGAAATFSRAGITGRVRIESGHLFQELPSGADAIIMKHILHDWDDDSATRI